MPNPVTSRFPTYRKPLEYTGVNISSGEWVYLKPGAIADYGVNYVYPAPAQIEYFAAAGMNIFRVPFTWQLLQPDPLRPLVAVELARLKDSIRLITGAGLIAILDPHSFGKYCGKLLGTADAPDEWFGDFWRRLATEFRDDERVWFGLINEPYEQSAAQWLRTANAGVAAIRSVGASQLILVPGTHWDGAHSWIESGNDIMADIDDPFDNWQFEAHQYVDSDSSGTHPEIVSPTIGSERLVEFTEWCRAHGKRALLGEFGVPVVDGMTDTIHDMIGYMEANADVWFGFTWWAAGSLWNNYMFSIEPGADGADAPQMAELRDHLQKP